MPDWPRTTWNSWMRSRFSASATSIRSASPRVPIRLKDCTRWVPAIGIARGRVLNWAALVRRADAAPAEVVPGLLGSSLRAAYAGPLDTEAIAATGRDGRFAVTSSVRAGLRDHDVVVTEVRDLG